MSFSVERNKALYNNTCSLLQIEETKEPIKKNGHSVAVIVSDSVLQDKGKHYVLNTQGKMNLACYVMREYGAPYGKGQRFGQEICPGEGTAFLYSPDTLITAAHCIYSPKGKQYDLKRKKFIFDFKTKDDEANKIFPKENVYEFFRIVACRFSQLPSTHHYYSDKDEDWAIIRLKRRVLNRDPLKICDKKVKKFAPIYMLGHPVGLALKYSGPAKIKKNINIYSFEADLDSFGGNSGSPVFNEQHEVIGILVRGRQDFSIDEDRKVTIMTYVDNSSFEAIQRITNILEKNKKRGFIPFSVEDSIGSFSQFKINKSTYKFIRKITIHVDYTPSLDRILATIKLANLSIKEYLNKFEEEQKKLSTHAPIENISSRVRTEFCVVGIAIDCIQKDIAMLSESIEKMSCTPLMKKMTLHFITRQQKSLEEIFNTFIREQEGSGIPKTKFGQEQEDIINLLTKYKIITLCNKNKTTYLRCDTDILKAVIIRRGMMKMKNLSTSYSLFLTTPKKIKKVFPKKIQDTRWKKINRETNTNQKLDFTKDKKK